MTSCTRLVSLHVWLALGAFLVPTTTALSSWNLSLHETRQLFLQAAQDSTGYYHQAPAVPKKKGYLRRDDGRIDQHAPDVFDSLPGDFIDCAFLTSFGESTTTPYVTKGVVLDTKKVIQECQGHENTNEACTTLVSVALGQCGWSTQVLDWTVASSRADSFVVHCPRNDFVVTTATCHAEAMGEPGLVGRVQVLPSQGATVTLEAMANTLFTCRVICQAPSTTQQR